MIWTWKFCRKRLLLLKMFFSRSRMQFRQLLPKIVLKSSNFFLPKVWNCSKLSIFFSNKLLYSKRVSGHVKCTFDGPFRKSCCQSSKKFRRFFENNYTIPILWENVVLKGILRSRTLKFWQPCPNILLNFVEFFCLKTESVYIKYSSLQKKYFAETVFLDT